MARLSLNYPWRRGALAAALLCSIAGVAFAEDNLAVATAPQATLPSAITTTQPADWRKEIGTFKIGLVRGWSSDMSFPAITRVEETFAQVLGVAVKVVVFERFTSLMDAHADGRIDMAAYSARAFATLQLKCECIEALAAPSTIDGHIGQIALMIGDRTTIPNLAAITSQKMGRVLTSTITSQDMLRGQLVVAGKGFTGKETYWVDYQNFGAMMAAYQNNEIDGFVLPASAAAADDLNAGTNEIRMLNDLTKYTAARPASIIWRSSLWPYGPIAVRDNLAPEAKTIILQTLKELDVQKPQVHATLSEGLSGPFLQANTGWFSAVQASLRLLVSQNTNWR